VHQRANVSLQHANIAISTVAQNAFSSQNVHTATARLAAPPVKIEYKDMAEKISELKIRQRKKELKAEREATAGVLKAMKPRKKPSKTQFDNLAKACERGINFYSKDFELPIKEHQQGIQEVINDIEVEEDFAKTENRQFNRAPLEGKLQERKASLNNFVKSTKADRFAAMIDTLLEARLRENETIAAELTKAIMVAETSNDEGDVAKVIELAVHYREAFADHAAGYQQLPGRERPFAVVDQERILDDIIYGADAKLFSLKQARLGPPPWDPTEQAEGDDLIDKSREFMAKEAIKTGKTHRPSGGQSDVIVIKDALDKPAFAFKSAIGETSQMGLPRGGGAIREAVTSRVTDSILQQTGYDFGFPTATIATIDGKVGALVEGVDGTLLPASNEIRPQDRADIAAFQNKIPGKELQKAIFAGLVTGNFLDLKWDNVFWEAGVDHPVARPFDAGASFLPSETINYQMYTRRPGSPPPDIGGALLTDAENNPVKGAKEPMDRELMEAMLKIDVRALEKVIDDELKRHAATGLDKFLDDDSKRNGLKCLEALQTVLHAHQSDVPLPSLETIMAEVQVEILKTFPRST
jgi:hypothetical protein